MSRVLLVSCLVLAIPLSGCVTTHPPATELAPVAPPAEELVGKPVPMWIGAGAAVPSDDPNVPTPPPPPPPAPIEEPSWATKVARGAGHALAKTAEITGEVTLGALLIGGAVGLIVLYAVAAGNTGRGLMR